jgi:hypothetical protein
MTDPDKIRAEALRPDPSATGMVPLDSLDPNSIEPLEPQPPAYAPEPLFNKKLMLAWALGAAAVWFAVKFVVPIAVDSARTAVVESVREVETNGGVRIKIERDKTGKIYNITRIEGPATPAATAAPAAGAAVPAPTPPAAAQPPDAANAPPKKK